MGRCIWCLQLNSSSAVEHIIPEALGCPEGFQFTDGTVCQSCNNKLGHIDQAVINDFDIVTFDSGVKRKGGRLPSINSRGNMTGHYLNKEKTITLNMGLGTVTDAHGNRVVPYAGGERHVNAKFSRRGADVEIEFKVPFGKSKKFRRGIYKIALGSLAYFLGASIALSEEFDAVRDFVKKGKGDRFVFFKQLTDKKFKNQIWAPYVSEEGHYSVVMRLAFIEILVDLSPHQTITPVLMMKSRELYGDDGWSYSPHKNS